MKHYFDVEELFEEQEKVLCSFFKGKDVYFSAPTGYGKLLIFQAIPLEADFLLEQATMTSCILVVSPLQSLMLDQIQLLREKGISAAGIYADQTKEVLEEIATGGIHTVIFTSPESMLATDHWRRFLSLVTLAEHCVGVAFDEAHFISQW